MATSDAHQSPPPLTGTTVGFIGLGLMGRPMARHLLAAGAEVVVWNRSAAAVDDLVADGATRACTAADVAEQTAGAITVLMLWSGEVIRAVLGHKEGFLDTVAPGSLVIDMGTTDMATTRWLHGALPPRSAGFLDAPVSGGTRGAEEGALSVFVGGEAVAFERALPVLNVLGDTVTHMGAAGAGQVTKLANQVIVAETVTAVAEAFRLAESAGVEPSKVRAALRGGFADSRILELHGDRMVRGDYAPGGRVSAQLKDVVQALQLGRENGLDLPALVQNVALWQAMVDAGMGGIDHSAAYAFLKGRPPADASGPGGEAEG